MDGFGVSVPVMNTRMINACRCKKKPRKSFYGNARLLPFVLGLFWFLDNRGLVCRRVPWVRTFNGKSIFFAAFPGSYWHIKIFPICASENNFEILSESIRILDGKGTVLRQSGGNARVFKFLYRSARVVCMLLSRCKCW